MKEAVKHKMEYVARSAGYGRGFLDDCREVAE